MNNILLIFALGIILFTQSCDDREPQSFDRPASGLWRAELQLDTTDPAATLPFTFVVQRLPDSTLTATIINGAERIEADEIRISADSLIVQLPAFDSEIRAIFSRDTMYGKWHNYAKGPGYTIPFSAILGTQPRFFPSAEPHTAMDVSGRWAVRFSPDSDDEYPAVGEFRQNGHMVSGTFLTETGDYRYLEGIADGGRLALSCFDGAHAFLFEARLQPDSALIGWFRSGSHWKEPWTARRDDDARLRHPDSLTFLKQGYDKLTFAFPDINGDTVRLSDPRFAGKVIIVQLMGSWCPNCMDETRFLADLEQRHRDRGLVVIGLAYEKSAEFSAAQRTVRRFRERLGAEYDFLIAGVSDKIKAATTLPMLNHILSFPTTIYIDRSGAIRKIHTGFSGPGTGDYYTRHVERITAFVEILLDE